MPDFNRMVETLCDNRFSVAALGVLIMFMGYRLHRAHIAGQGGDLNVRTGDGAQLSLRNAPPGTFFALFGAVVVSVAIFRGVEVSTIPVPTQVIYVPSESSTQSPTELEALFPLQPVTAPATEFRSKVSMSESARARQGLREQVFQKWQGILMNKITV